MFSFQYSSANTPLSLPEVDPVADRVVNVYCLEVKRENGERLLKSEKIKYQNYPRGTKPKERQFGA